MFVELETIERICSTWLGSPWLEAQFNAQRKKAGLSRESSSPLRFTTKECADFGRYCADATVLAPSHGFLKATKSLVLDLGLMHDGIHPGAEIERLERRFPLEAVCRINAKRKLGMSVMFEIVAEARAIVEKYGAYQWLVDEASHFGYGGIYARALAEQGLVVQIQNTAGRGGEVRPFLGSEPSMGTNPITFAFPTKAYLGFDVCADYAWSMISMGKKARLESAGLELPEGAAVDRDGVETRNPSLAEALLFSDHKAFAQALHIEAMAALMGGGKPKERGLRVADRPGGGSDWIISVASPDFYSCKAGDPLERLAKCLRFIVDSNGAARLPGSAWVEKMKELEKNHLCVQLNSEEYSHLEELAKTAELSL